MTALRVITIIAWVMVALVLLGLAGWFVTGTVFGARPVWIDWQTPFRLGGGFNTGTGFNIEPLTGSFNVISEHSLDPSGIDSISIDWVAGAVTVRSHGGDMIEITEFAQRTLNNNERLSVNTQGTTLEINFIDHASNGRIVRMPEKRLEVLVPDDLALSMNWIYVDSVSGRVDVDGFNVQRLDIDTASGAISLSSTVADKMSLDSISGAIDVENSRADEMEIDTTSGAIRVRESSANHLILDSISGAIRASGVFSSVEADTTSGAVSLENDAVSSVTNTRTVSGAVSLSGMFSSVTTNTSSGAVSIRSLIVPASLHLRSISGTIDVTIPNEGIVSVSHSSTSGRLNSEVPMILDGPDAQFTFSTTSGHVNIWELR